MIGNSPHDRRGIFADVLRRRNLDCALISNPKHILYFTGLQTNLNPWITLMRGSRSTSFLIIDNDGRAFLLLGSSESPKDTLQLRDISVGDGVKLSTYVDYDLRKRMLTYGDAMSAELQKWLQRLRGEAVKLRRVGIEDWHLASVYRDRICKTTKTPQFSGISKTILSMRRRKCEDEISYIRKATEMIEFAYQVVQSDISEGSSENELYRKINYEAFGKYGPFAWIMGIDVEAGERKFSKGNTVILDLQVAFRNYWSDLSRTYVVGDWSKDQERRLGLLVNAKKRGEELLKPGTKCKEIYELITQVLVQGGFSQLPHHAGHGVGLDDQEPPFIIPGSDEKIEEGDVCVLEPGIYPQSSEGMRIEDCYVIRKNGPEKISSFPI
jgi:Xaa-Pro aminopeptidase